LQLYEIGSYGIGLGTELLGRLPRATSPRILWWNQGDSKWGLRV